jgi:hypothetical protein
MSVNEPNNYQNKLVIPNGNYLQVYSSGFALESELLTGQAIGQIGKDTRFNNTIIGIFRINSTAVSFKSFGFNSSTQVFQLNSEINQSFSGNVNSTGLSCLFTGGTNHCYSSFTSYNGANYTLFMTDYTDAGVNMVQTSQSRHEKVSIPFYEDLDNDGQLDIIAYSPRDVFIIQKSNLALKNVYREGSTGGLTNYIRYVSSGYIDATAYPKLLIASDNGNEDGSANVGTNHVVNLKALRFDLSTLWSSDVGYYFCGGGCGATQRSGNFIVSDYNADNRKDIAIIYQVVQTTTATLKVIKGTDGSTLSSRTIGFATRGANSGQNDKPFPASLSLTGGRLSNSTGTNYDVVIQGSNYDGVPSVGTGINFITYNLQEDRIVNNIVAYSSGTGNYGCAIADFIYDGYNDIICSRKGNSFVVGLPIGAVTNNAPTINSLAFSPSATITIGENLGVSVSATDPESDSILYIADCGNGVDFPEQASNSFSCTYSTAGTYTFTAYVRDAYHFTYNSFNYSILVTNVGGACNYNDVCEAGLGESVSNCPEDCVSGGAGSSVGGENGTMSIPIQLVDTTQIYEVGQERGLLPEIYYGTLSFLSNSLAPIFILVFVIFIVLIMFAIGTIVKKIFMKVSG